MMDKSHDREIRMVSNEAELAKLGAEVFIQCACEAVSRRGIFSVMLAGGNTPKKMYQHLSSSELFNKVPWENTHVFWGDERTVPPHHPESNFLNAWESLLRFVPIPLAQIHRVHTELGLAEQIAADYEKQLRNFIGKTEGVTESPHFDLILLGMGEDGHTASLFPGFQIPSNDKQWALSLWVPHLNSYRISVSPRIINFCRQVIFLVSGEKKAQPLQEVLEGKYDPSRYPAQQVHPQQGKSLWIIDRSAASLLKNLNLSKAG